MNKPIIAIFIATNLATKKEEQLIDKYMRYPHIILNAETFTTQESVMVDAVCGKVPAHLKHLPDPDTVIAKYEQYLAGTGDNVGGNPPTPPSNDPNGETGDNKGDTPPPPPPPVPPSTGFGNPPTPPANNKDK